MTTIGSLFNEEVEEEQREPLAGEETVGGLVSGAPLPKPARSGGELSEPGFRQQTQSLLRVKLQPFVSDATSAFPGRGPLLDPSDPRNAPPTLGEFFSIVGREAREDIGDIGVGIARRAKVAVKAGADLLAQGPGVVARELDTGPITEEEFIEQDAENYAGFLGARKLARNLRSFIQSSRKQEEPLPFENRKQERLLYWADPANRNELQRELLRVNVEKAGRIGAFRGIERAFSEIASDELRAEINEFQRTQGPFEEFVDILVENGPRMLASAGVLTIGTLVGQPQAGMAAAIGVTGSGEYISFYDSALQSGLDKDIIRRHARVFGAVSGVIEFAQVKGITKAFSRIKPLRGLMKKTYGNTLRWAMKEFGVALQEGLEEGSQGLLFNALMRNAITEHNARHGTSIGMPGLTDGLARDVVLGAAVATVYRLPGHGLNLIRGKGAKAQAQDTLEKVSRKTFSERDMSRIMRRTEGFVTGQTKMDPGLSQAHEEVREGLMPQLTREDYAESVRPLLEGAAVEFEAREGEGDAKAWLRGLVSQAKAIEDSLRAGSQSPLLQTEEIREVGKVVDERWEVMLNAQETLQTQEAIEPQTKEEAQETQARLVALQEEVRIREGEFTQASIMLNNLLGPQIGAQAQSHLQDTVVRNDTGAVRKVFQEKAGDPFDKRSHFSTVIGEGSTQGGLLQVTNPLPIDDPGPKISPRDLAGLMAKAGVIGEGQIDGLMTGDPWVNLSSALLKAGHDGLVYTDVVTNQPSYIILDEGQFLQGALPDQFAAPLIERPSPVSGEVRLGIEDIENQALASLKRGAALVRQIDPDVEIRENILARGAREILNLWDMQEPLRPFPVGQTVIDLAGDKLALEKTYWGMFAEDVFLAQKGLTRADKKWLRGSEGIHSNLVRAIEGPSSEFVDEIKVPDNPRIQITLGLLQNIQEYFGKEAESARLFRRGRRGKVERFRRAKGGRVPRLLTQKGVEALENPNSPLGRSLRDAIRTAPGNEDFAQDSNLLEIMLGSIHEGWTRAGTGMLEHVRKIPNFPSFVTLVDGKRVAVLHTDIITIMQQAVKAQANKIAWSRTFGQGLGDNPSVRVFAQIAKALKVSPRFTVEVMRDRLVVNGLVSEAEAAKLTMKELKNIGRGHVPLGSTRADFLTNINGVSTLEGFTPKELKAVRRAADTIEGVSTGLEGDALLAELKERANEDLEDLAPELIRLARRQGGPKLEERVTKYLDMVQGRPYAMPTKNVALKIFKQAGQIIKIGHLSLLALPNIVQPMQDIPLYTGEIILMRARLNVLKNPIQVSRRGASNGAYPLSFSHFDTENGPTTSSMIRVLSNTASRLFLTKFMFHKNNVLSAEAFRLLAEKWRDGGIPVESQWKAQDLGLTEGEIADINKGAMSELTFKKIIQEGVAKTQFVTEPRYRKGYLQNNPLALALIAYQDFRGGKLRSLVRLAKAWPRSMRALAKGNPRPILTAMTRTINLFLRAGIAGWMIRALRDAVLGRAPTPEQEERNVPEQYVRDAISLYTFGNIGMMLSGSVEGPEDMVLGVMPIADTIKDVWVTGHNALSKLADWDNWGRFGDLPLTDQGRRLLKRNVGVYRAGMKLIDKWLWPEHQKYLEARAWYFHWLESTSDKTRQSSDRPLDPDLFAIGEAAKRFDQENARRLVGVLLKKSKKDKPTILHDEIRDKVFDRVFSSLMAKRPIPLAFDSPEWTLYRKSLTKEQQVRFHRLNEKYIDMVHDLTAKKRKN